MAARESDDLDSLLERIASDMYDNRHIVALGYALGFSYPQIRKFIKGNTLHQEVTNEGTVSMLHEWSEGKNPLSLRSELREALLEAKLVLIAETHLPPERMEKFSGKDQGASIGSSTEMNQEACQPTTTGRGAAGKGTSSGPRIEQGGSSFNFNNTGTIGNLNFNPQETNFNSLKRASQTSTLPQTESKRRKDSSEEEPTENAKQTEQRATVKSSTETNQGACKSASTWGEGSGNEIVPDGDGHYKQPISPARPTVKQLDPKENYRMNKWDKGMAFVLNNNKFDKEKQRMGSKIDLENVKHVFGEIGYTVKTKTDRTADEIIGDLTSLKENIRRSDTSLVLVFMSHGKRRGILGKDGTIISVEKIKEMFSGKNCPDLKGKPKIFFFQACRGRKVTPSATDKSEQPEGSTSSGGGAGLLDDTGDESGEEVNEGASAAGRSSPQVVEVDFGPDEEDGSPDNADMFICYATCDGYVSLRHRVNGSWFIQALCEELLAGAHLDDLYTIMTKVSGRVNKQKGFIVLDNCKVLTRQTTQTVSQGIEKKIYFLPKYPAE